MAVIPVFIGAKRMHIELLMMPVGVSPSVVLAILATALGLRLRYPARTAEEAPAPLP